mmetsp:Transcript_24218/g.41451  ORF Transcript_24218/g.41451 Transcript_24218/m.41451 type:complete len:594 (+) Transcript_24218:388-2169(+)
MLILRRCLTTTTTRLSRVNIHIARAGASAIDTRKFTTSPSLHNGNLADVCDVHVVSSPLPPILDSSHYTPVQEFVSASWKDDALVNKVAIRDGSTGETRTFSDYENHMNSIASALKSEYNLQPDETVALYSPNNVDYLPICLAVGLCGAKVTPINPLSTAGELSKVLVPSKSKILFTHAKLLPVALEAAHAAPCVEHVVVIPDVTADTDLPAGAEHFNNLLAYEKSDNIDSTITDLEKHPWLLPYSSGTTGLPKGVMLSHANIVANLLQKHGVENLPQDQKLISPLPFFHIYGMLASLLYCGWRGKELITMSDRFDLEKFCELVQEHKPHRAHLVPPIILGLAKHPIVDNYDMSGLKMIISAAAPLGKETEEAARKRLGLDIKQAWGMSELSPLGTMVEDTNQRIGSIGPVVSSTHGKIIDPETGKSLGPNERGELCIKGPQVMMGYFNDIEKTKECLSDGGWLRTGDLAYSDEDGFFYIDDRLKELIKVRGFQVAPAELEELILHNEHVQDVAVIQVPDEVSGELPRAYVVLKPSANTEEVTEEYLKDWVKERVSPHKRISGGVAFVDQIPKSASGKILRRVLRDGLKEEGV